MKLEPAPALLATVLGDLASYDATGSLLVQVEDVERILCFKKGVLVAALSEIAEEKLGALFVKWGRLSEEQVHRGLKVVEDEPGLLGKWLVAAGYLAEDELTRALASQARTRVLACFRAEKFKYRFVRDLPTDYFPVHFPIPALVLDAVRSTYERDRLYKELHVGENLRMRRTGDVPLERFLIPIHSPEAKVLELLEQDMTLGDLVAEDLMHEHDLLSFIHVMWSFRKLTVSTARGR